MTLLEDWLALTDKLLRAGVTVMSDGVVDLTEESRADPKVIDQVCGSECFELLADRV
jgi:hypothetical protein